MLATCLLFCFPAPFSISPTKFPTFTSSGKLEVNRGTNRLHPTPPQRQYQGLNFGSLIRTDARLGEETQPNRFSAPDGDGDCSERKLDSWGLSESNVDDGSDAEKALRLDFNHLFISNLIGLEFLDFSSKFEC